jgi:hypothetical protein
VPADAERVEAAFGPFYPVSGSDRPRLPHRYRTRFMNGGGLAAETSYLVWLGSWGPPADLGAGIDVRFGPEAGPLGAVTHELPLSGVSVEVPAAALAEDLPPFGVLDVGGHYFFWNPPGLHALELVVWPVFRADGRFSVGLEATPVDPQCHGSP